MDINIKQKTYRKEVSNSGTTANPFCEKLKIHYEEDMLGSRTITTK